MTQLAMDFGFEYMYDSSLVLRIASSGPENWSQGETAILNDVLEIDSHLQPTEAQSMSTEEIAKSLKQPDTGQIIEIDPYTNSHCRAEDQANKWVEWHPFTLEVDGRRLLTLMPSARVLNQDLDKAIKAEVKSKIQALFKVMKQKFASPPDSGLR